MNTQHPDIIITYIKTKNKWRKIVTYKSDDCELKKYHKKINAFLSERFIPSIFAKGYTRNRSIYHNAVSHMYNDYFIMLDIKDFFPHICHRQLSEKIFYEINLLKSNQISKKECNDIVENCSISSRGLPLGLITSPILSNIYMKEFDNIFYGKLKQLNLDNIIYSRYADDITVSFKCTTSNKNETVENLIMSIAKDCLKRYGLQLNYRKIRTYNLNISNHVRITGVNIIKLPDNVRKLTIGRSIKNKLFWDAIDCVDCKDTDKINSVKGMHSFILSIEKLGYENCFSKTMMQLVKEKGFDTLNDLITSL